MGIIKKPLILVTVATISLLVMGELIARFYLGLGAPPLSVSHPRIEYMFEPNQDIYRFGNHILINQYGMRTPSFSENSAGELRIMVFGDSVLNGGSQTDHAALATTILQEKLSRTTGKKVVVGNISAGSWGPGNWLAYAQEYGFFDADVVALIISSHDSTDNPNFQPLNEDTHPTRRPAFALAEGVTRYLPRYLPRFITKQEQGETDQFTASSAEDEVEKGLRDLKDFLLFAKKSAKKVLVFQHWENEEIERGEARRGNTRIQEVCAATGVSTIQLMPYFRQSIENGDNPYRDNIHPNQTGQKLIAQALLENLAGVAKGPTKSND